MESHILLAFLGGLLTIGAPCVLPVLPIILGASIGQRSKLRPLFIALGFSLTFSVFGLFLSYAVSRIHVNASYVHDGAAVALMLFGLLLLFQHLWERVAAPLSGAATSAQGLASRSGSGAFGGLVLGVVLGVIWTPCAGPILASILALVASQGSSAAAGKLLLAYSLGAGVPMLVIAYGGQFVTTRVRTLAAYTDVLQKIFGIIIILIGLATLFGYDTQLVAKLLSRYNFASLEERLIPVPPSAGFSGSLPNVPINMANPKATTTMTDNGTTPNKPSPDLRKPEGVADLGPAPELTGISGWLNSEPLTMQALRGKVVLVDFWTYSCINCIRTLPYVTGWYGKYKEEGFVVLGVHTPEFEFEKSKENVAAALKRFGITYPVAQDNDFGTWNAYQNQYWPAHYLVDKQGQVRYTHFGEGKYQETEMAIRYLLGETGTADVPSDDGTPIDVGTPEIYLGTARLQYLSREQVEVFRSVPAVNGQSVATLTQPSLLAPNTYGLGGRWGLSPEQATCLSDSCSVRLSFSAAKVHMVASADGAAPLEVQVKDPSAPATTLGTLKVKDPRLYTVHDYGASARRQVEIDVPKGFQLFTFTFG